MEMMLESINTLRLFVMEWSVPIDDDDPRDAKFPGMETGSAIQSPSLGQRHSTNTNGPLVSNGEILRSRKQQRQDRRRSHYNFTGFNGLPIDSRGYDTDEDYGISDWKRGRVPSSLDTLATSLPGLSRLTHKSRPLQALERLKSDMKGR